MMEVFDFKIQFHLKSSECEMSRLAELLYAAVSFDKVHCGIVIEALVTMN